MVPYIHIWHFSVPTFGLMLWLAAVAAAFVMDRGFKRASLDADAVGMVAIAVLAGIVGAKLWHVIDTPSEFRELGWRVLWDTAGFAWFGGLVFGISALLWSDLVTLQRTDVADAIHVPQLRLLAAGNGNRTMRGNECLPLFIRNDADEFAQPIRLQTALDLIDQRDARFLPGGRGDLQGDHPPCAGTPIGERQTDLVLLRQQADQRADG